MTPLEQAFFLQTGRALLDDVASLITSTLFHGFFLILFIIAVSHLKRRGLSSTRAWASLCLTVISFLLASLWWGSFVVGLVVWVRASLIESLTGAAVIDKARIISINSRLAQITQVTNWVPRFLPIITDGVVIWRAWALFVDQRWLILIPLALLLGTIGTSAVYLILTANPAVINAAIIGKADYVVQLVIASLLLSLATNIVSTILITYKLLSHRRVMKSLGVRHKSSLGQRVMIVLIETGGLYCILQGINALTESLPAFQGSALRITGRVFFAAYIEISAMYPTIVVLLVASRRSLVDTYGFVVSDSTMVPGEKDDERRVTVGHLSFAISRSVVTTVDESGRSVPYIGGGADNSSTISRPFRVDRAGYI